MCQKFTLGLLGQNMQIEIPNEIPQKTSTLVNTDYDTICSSVQASQNILYSASRVISRFSFSFFRLISLNLFD